MSADNILVAIPAKDGQVALYDVSMSSISVDLDGPSHEVCSHIARTYAHRRVGVYPDAKAMEEAADRYMGDGIVEYGLVDLSSPIREKKARPGPGIG